ncbi:MAG TPA: LLM class F420-dependent oxidoreductase [Acetobacteraceae bacterium]|jgi:F420-dependent oxidoreductase-like protein|nr:LLM class F420-dependent oxidoreductase [Acetobacteraceae bacterium]
MQLGITLRINGATPKLSMDEVLEAERLGYVSVWGGEAWGTDAVSPAAWVLARTTRIKAGTSIMQMQARTPACAAMTAMTLQALSNNRFLLGVGASGPQVIEGWHGVPYGKPLGRTKEYIEIVRKILARDAPLTHQGEHYQIPYTGPGSTGLGKPLRSIVHGDPSLPIYTASITPAGLRTAGEVSDGTLPIWFSPEQADLIAQPIFDGMKQAGKPANLAKFDLAPYVKVSMGPDLQACRDAVRPNLALYIGGMGARSKNFYNDFAVRLGYAEAAAKIQDLYLDGHKKDAEALVPDALIDEIALAGTADRIKDRLQVWKQAAKDGKLTTMVLTGASIEAMRVVAEAVL